MAQHRADETYVPLKTATVLLWFAGLFTAIVVGMSVGGNFSVFPSPLFGPFPMAQAPELEDVFGGGGHKYMPAKEEAVAPAPEVEEPVTIISSTSEPVSPQVAVAPEIVRTPEMIEESHIPIVTEAPVSVTPTPAPVTETPVVTETPAPVTETPVVTTPPVTETPAPVTEEPVVTETPAPETSEPTVTTEPSPTETP